MNIISPYATEKTFALIERENSLQFIVDRDADKASIRREVETLFDVKVVKVTLKSGKKGKVATVRLEAENSASELATRIGVV